MSSVRVVVEFKSGFRFNFVLPRSMCLTLAKARAEAVGGPINKFQVVERRTACRSR